MSEPKTLKERRKEKIASGSLNVLEDPEVLDLLFPDTPQGKESKRLMDNWARALVSTAIVDLDSEARRRDMADLSSEVAGSYLKFIAMGMMASGRYEREEVERAVAIWMVHANMNLQSIKEYASKRGDYCIQEESE